MGHDLPAPHLAGQGASRAETLRAKTDSVCGRGGTGRRAGLKIRFPKGVSVRFRPPAPTEHDVFAGSSAMSDRYAAPYSKQLFDTL